MQEAELDSIRATAHQLANTGGGWHFHILTPNCALNDKPHFAFILEDVDNVQAWVHYSQWMEQELGSELLPLLHKVSATPADEPDNHYQPSAKVHQILTRAQELNAAGTRWHHHVLFPGCMFNMHSPRYVLMFEDPEQGNTIEQVSDSEPTPDLKLLEPLFYAQRKG
jgi:hypothetical protein